MSPIGIKQNVYDSIKDATDDYRPLGIGGKKNINDSELVAIEKEMASDGKIDTGEKSVLDALKSGTSFSVKSITGKETTSISPKSFDFPTKSKVSNVRVGDVTFISNLKSLTNTIPDTVPAQTKGNQTNIRNEKTFANRSEASKAYDEAVTKLTNPNNWYDTASIPMTGSVFDENNMMMNASENGTFKLIDSSGKPVTRAPKVGDYLKINIPGPTGDDWVKIEAIDKKGDSKTPTESTSITVRPSAPPGSPAGTPVKHFYSGAATNTLVVERKGNTVTAGVYGRNEVPNTGSGIGKPTKALNYSVAQGAMNGASNPQWDNLTKGLLGLEKD